MYIPSYFRVTDQQEIKSFISENSFATIVSNNQEQMVATHTPLVYKDNDDGFLLYGHVSKANQHWHVLDNNDVLAIFLGPHAYVSSQWYDHVNVPTWNYLAVHIYGKASLIEGEELKNVLRDMMDKYEANTQNPMRFDDMPTDFRESEMRGVVGFKIQPNDIQAAYKLSQNRDDKNYHHVVKNLEESSDQMDQSVAHEMKKRKNS